MLRYSNGALLLEGTEETHRTGPLKGYTTYQDIHLLNYVLCQFTFLDGNSGGDPDEDAALGN